MYVLIVSVFGSSRNAVFEVNHTDAILVRFQKIHGVNSRVERPEGVNLKFHLRPFQQLIFHDLSAGIHEKFLGVVMISQRDSVFRQFLLRLVQKRNVGFHHIRGLPMRCRYDQIVAPDRLVVSDGRVDLPGHKLIDPRVRSRADQTESVKPPLDPQPRFSSAFTFIYSPRPGTPAAAMEQIPRDVVQDRFDRLVALQEQITEENLATFEGRDVEVMITGKLGKKDTDTHRVTGREKTGVLVHIGVPEGEPVPEIGDFVTATVTHAGRHNLLADPDVAAGQTYSVRH